MKQISIYYYKSPAGEMILGSYEGKLCLADWRDRKMRTGIDKRLQKALNAEYVEGSSEVIETTLKQLEAYFRGQRNTFDVPLLVIGTDFQKSVWQGLLEIPYGQTASYLAFAQKINKAKSVRAVASANGANALSILIPCHRIIGANGDLVGYAGGLPAKKILLDLEYRFKERMGQ